ncbi:MAG TPA: DNA-3-methyladenine glycosylase [Methanoregulaceae archaeon]|nr:DNA-3-methyladenine glycosylase [Methanoregulaceae archaeon]
MTDFVLTPKIPYNFHLSAAIFSGGDPAIRTYSNGTFTQALLIGGQPFRVRLGRDAGSARLNLSVFPDPADTGVGDPTVRDAVISLFNIYDDLIPFYRTVGEDLVMSRLVRDLEGLKVPTTATVFEALVDSIIEQQISLPVAHTLQTRLIKETGTEIEDGNSLYYCYPTPNVLAATPPALFRRCGMTARKGEYIREISAAIVSGDLDVEAFRNYPDTEEIIDEMVRIRGIGKWTAELTVLRGIHKLDAFPADDVALRRIIAGFYRNGDRIDAGEAREIAKQWGSYKGLAAFYLEIADHLGIGT